MSSDKIHWGRLTSSFPYFVYTREQEKTPKDEASISLVFLDIHKIIAVFPAVTSCSKIPSRIRDNQYFGHIFHLTPS